MVVNRGLEGPHAKGVFVSASSMNALSRHRGKIPICRSGHRTALEANLIFNQAGENQVSAESLDLFEVGNQDIKFGSRARAMRSRQCPFDKCRVFEIETPALFLAIGVLDIKDIKRGRTPRRGMELALALRHFKNSPNELKDGTNVRSGRSLRTCGTDKPARCLSPNAVFKNSPIELKDGQNVRSGKILRTCATDEPAQRLSPNAAFKNSPNELKEARNV